MKYGRVKFWNENKNYGFIIEDGTGKEFYTFHKLLMPEHKRLWNENKVSFETKENCGPNKNETHAINIKIV